MPPPRSLRTGVIVYMTISAGATTAIAGLCAAMGWTVESRAWIAFAPIAMWAPALGAQVARRYADRDRTALLPLRWSAAGDLMIRPLLIPLVVFGAAYAIAVLTRRAHWSPGAGRWTTGSQIAANVILNLTILSIVGTLTAMGEEIGWRGYLQPRLDAAGVRASVVVVALCELAYHAPFIMWTGYDQAGGLGVSLALFAAGSLPWTFIAAYEAYRARSLWPAVFFHSFHNTISQWLFPRFFSVDSGQSWIRDETGVLPALGYAAVAAVLYMSMRRRGQSWRALAGRGSAVSADTVARAAR